jgi:hypothetical protein
MRRQQPPDIYAHLNGYHAHEWRRFVIRSSTFKQAANLAADLGWWLHCWTWEHGEVDEPGIVENPPPEPHATWETYVAHQDAQRLAALNNQRRGDC